MLSSRPMKLHVVSHPLVDDVLAALRDKRTTSTEFRRLAHRVSLLVAAGRLEVDDEARVIDGIARTIADELSIEDRLNEEAREVLAQHMIHMERSDITYSEMFKKVKRELAKKKGIVL